jgi:hypothetical protein
MLEFSQEEKVLRFVYHLVCNRLPTMGERSQYYNQLKTGEITELELASILTTPCGKGHLTKQLTSLNVQQGNGSRSDTDIVSFIDRLLNGTRFDFTDWSKRMPNQVYAWTVDFHASPAACNIPIYRDIGVVLHPEVDHHPNCDYTVRRKGRILLLRCLFYHHCAVDMLYGFESQSSLSYNFMRIMIVVVTYCIYSGHLLHCPALCKVAI